MRHRRGEEDLSGRTLCFAQSVLPGGLRFYGKFVLCSIWSCWEVGFGNATAIALARDAAAKLCPGVMPVETCGDFLARGDVYALPRCAWLLQMGDSLP